MKKAFCIAFAVLASAFSSGEVVVTASRAYVDRKTNVTSVTNDGVEVGFYIGANTNKVFASTNLLAGIDGIKSDRITDGTNIIDAAGDVFKVEAVGSTDASTWTYQTTPQVDDVFSMSLNMEWSFDEMYGGYGWYVGALGGFVGHRETSEREEYSCTVFVDEGEEIEVHVVATRELAVSTNYVGKIALTNDIPPSVEVVAPSTNAAPGQAADAKATGTALANIRSDRITDGTNVIEAARDVFLDLRHSFEPWHVSTSGVHMVDLFFDDMTGKWTNELDGVMWFCDYDSDSSMWCLYNTVYLELYTEDGVGEDVLSIQFNLVYSVSRESVYKKEYVGKLALTNDIAEALANVRSDRITDGTNTIDAAGNVLKISGNVYAPWTLRTNGVAVMTFTYTSDMTWVSGRARIRYYGNPEGTWEFTSLESEEIWFDYIEEGSDDILSVETEVFFNDTETSSPCVFDRPSVYLSATNYVGKLALTNQIPDTKLSPACKGSPEFTEWTGNGSLTVVYTNGFWGMESPAQDLFLSTESDPLATSFSVDAAGNVYTATRTYTNLIGYTLGNQTNIVLSSTGSVVSPSTNAVSGQAADAKATGTALYTGFTEWEFRGSAGVPVGEIEDISYVGGSWMLSFVSSSEWYSDTEPSGTGYELDLEFYVLNFDNPSDYGVVTATRHLVTPTKTSQLENDGTNGVPFATMNQIPDVSGKLDSVAAYPAWDDFKDDYDTGDVVSFGGKLYSSLHGGNGSDAPNVDTNHWNEITLQTIVSSKADANPLSGQTFDFADMRGVYLSLSNIIDRLGGSVTNFPAFNP